MEGKGTAGPPHCALMNLFCSAEHLADWRAANPGERGQIRTLAEVAELGRAEWGALSQGSCCDAEECQPWQTLATGMQFLFDVDLRYHESMVALPRPDGAGNLIGSGIGQIDGPQLRGRLRWSNFEYSRPDGCQLTLVGDIETEDGATIHFDSRGFALPPDSGTEWKVVAAVRFIVGDPRYQWLQAIRAARAGEFDGSNATARYRAFALESRNGNAG